MNTEKNEPIIKFLPYQKAWLDDDARFKIGMFARQTGKTFTNCAEIVKDCVQTEINNKKTRWVILSRGERQAKEAMDEGIKPFCKAYYALYKGRLKAEPTYSEYEIKVDKVSYTALETKFPNGSRITALPANADTARGFSANVLLDEFAFHQDSKKIWMAVFPIVSKGFKLRVVSTPNGKSNKFYELMTDKKGAWSKHIVDIYAAVKQGLDRNIEELRDGLGDEDAWSQEYELKWLDEASAWLPYDLITAVEDEQAGKPELYKGGACYIGVDIGIRSDLWVAWVIEEIGDVYWTREISTLHRTSFKEHDLVLDELMQKYRVARLGMDQTGLGEKPVEDAKRAYGSRAEGVIFTTGNKHILATIGKEAFEDRTIRIPMGDAILRADLHKLKKMTSPTGQPRFIAERDASGHADRTWALFLALNAGHGKEATYEYEAIKRQEKKGCY